MWLVQTSGSICGPAAAQTLVPIGNDKHEATRLAHLLARPQVLATHVGRVRMRCKRSYNALLAGPATDSLDVSGPVRRRPAPTGGGPPHRAFAVHRPYSPQHPKLWVTDNAPRLSTTSTASRPPDLLSASHKNSPPRSSSRLTGFRGGFAASGTAFELGRPSQECVSACAWSAIRSGCRTRCDSSI